MSYFLSVLYCHLYTPVSDLTQNRVVNEKERSNWQPGNPRQTYTVPRRHRRCRWVFLGLMIATKQTTNCIANKPGCSVGSQVRSGLLPTQAKLYGLKNKIVLVQWHFGKCAEPGTSLSFTWLSSSVLHLSLSSNYRPEPESSTLSPPCLLVSVSSWAQ